ncbi:MAG: hypothetical protein JOY78_05475, partial [Pseudonocardia sp.]|nr:hypothetical protein [Pseudonocardia sp.]
MRSTIELVITGSTRGLNAAAAQARAMAERIAAAEDRVSSARLRQAEASSRVAEAEARLARARQSGDPNAIVAASERLARARGQEFAASENLARAERDLQAIRRRGTDDLNRQRDGVLGVFDAFSRLADAFTGADGASTSLLSKLAAMNSVFSTIGGPIAQAVIGVVEFGAAAGAAVEIVGVLGGLIGQVLAGAPAILLALGAAAGTVALGMDGIKKAAAAAGPAFEKLKASVSGVFEQQLTPFFARIGQVLPQVTAGFDRIAVALSQVAKEVIAFVTSARGITTINSILNGTAALFQAMAPGIAVFTKGLLDAANIGGPAFQRLG